MTTRIEIRQQAALLDASRALQAANQRRLQERTEDERTWNKAMREIGQRRAQIDSRQSRAAGRKDPWRGAVPEFETPGFTPVQVRGKRFRVAGGYAQAVGDRLEVRTADGLVSQSTELLGPSQEIIDAINAGNLYEVAQGCFPWGILLPGGGDRLIFVYSQVWGFQTSLTGFPPYTEYYFNSHKSFIVTKDAVRVIDTPAPLREIGYRYNGRPVIRQDSGTMDDDIDHAPYTQDTFDVFSLKNMYLLLLRSFGYGRLLALEGSPSFFGGLAQSPNWGTTPAIFSFLKNYDGEFHLNPTPPESVTNAESYNYIKNKYFPSDTPDYMLTSGWQVPGAQVDTTNRLYYFRTPDLQNASIRSLDSFTVSENGIKVKPNRGQNASVPVSSDSALWRLVGQEYISGVSYNIVPASDSATNPIPLVTWDWNRPLACILQLQSLGFTAEDLMLTPEETAALAAADPAEVGFKF